LVLVIGQNSPAAAGLFSFTAVKFFHLKLQPLKESNMEYSKLVAVTGLPGLFEVVSSKADGAVVRSLEDGSTKFAATRSHNFSHLESIEIYTQRDNVNLVDIFHAIEKAGGSLPDTKDNAALTKYFEKVFPEMDFEKVYPSDMKKMVKWYEQLKKHNIEIKLTEVPEEPAEEVEEVKEPEPVAEEPKKKTTRKKKTE
jgi:Domain of unknown function (DUF5606)